MSRHENNTETPKSDEKTIKFWQEFDRKRLKKIMLLKSNHGNYCCRVKTLCKDTLTVSKYNGYFTPETLRVLMEMSLSALDTKDMLSFVFKDEKWASEIV